MPKPASKLVGRCYFVLAPREMSEVQLKLLLRKLLSKRPVVFGIAEEEYISGFEGQPQFKTLRLDMIKDLAERSGGKITILQYKQKNVVDVVNSLDFDRAIVVNGSNHRSFHLRPEYQAITDKGATVKYVSPFLTSREARDYADRFKRAGKLPEFNEKTILGVLKEEAAKAFINDFQTAAAIVKDGKIISLAHNVVVPYETYAWHNGLSREKHKCMPGDSSHYDTVHAEAAAITDAGEEARGSTMYMIVSPCPHCARHIAYAGIKEIVYMYGYGDSYGCKLLDEANIKRRVLNE